MMTRQLAVPFILRYREPIPPQPSYPVRYDAARCVTEVQVAGAWVALLDAPVDVDLRTRPTEVKTESTDE